MRRLAPLLALLLVACVQMSMGTTATPRPEKRQPPVPKSFEGSERPALEPTDRPGLERAPDLGPNVYLHRSEDLWYRWAYRRWYQAFRWNGNWFVLGDTPEILVGIEIVRVPLPELPELPDDEPATPPR